jgi:hypothetical protein
LVRVHGRDSDSFFENGIESGREREEIRADLLFLLAVLMPALAAYGNSGANEAFKSWIFKP